MTADSSFVNNKIIRTDIRTTYLAAFRYISVGPFGPTLGDGVKTKWYPVTGMGKPRGRRGNPIKEAERLDLK